MVRPLTWAEALAAKAAAPALLPIAGGTDVMVDLNFDRRRPPGLLDLTRVAALGEWTVSEGTVTLGAGVTYARVVDELADLLPGLAMASRTVGSPQIRNRGTVGGNLGAASPAGDSHPPLLATECEVEVLQDDANNVVRDIKHLDLAYLDPPYNQHPYGSNYFMLNLLVSKLLARKKISSMQKTSSINQDVRIN